MSTSGTGGVTGVGGTGGINTHTEQALTELVYVQTANDMLGSALTNLDTALNTTQSVLNILQGLQNLHNEINVKSKSTFNFNYFLGPSAARFLNPSHGTTVIAAPNAHATMYLSYGGIGIQNGNPVYGYKTKTRTTGLMGTRSTIHFCGNVTAYESAYFKAASAYFGQAIDPTFNFSSANAPGYSTYVDTLKSLKQKLSAEIDALVPQTPAASRNDPTSLLGTLRKVLAELPANFQFSTVEKWALDNYNVHGSTGASLAGNLQNDITFAITAAQSLNNAQAEKVRRYLFIFQEYYQSAAAILSGLSQIIQQMAQKISQ